MSIWLYTILSVLVVSLISLVGVFTIPFGKEKLNDLLIYFVSFSAGTLLGDAFIHLIPEAYEKTEALSVSLYILSGVMAFFALEKFVRWRHCHKIDCEVHPHHFSYIIIVGDTVHNFIDGLVIAASYLVSIPLGIATLTAVILHEIPQEIGDFGSLVYSGFSRMRAIVFNFLSALAAFGGAIVVLAIGSSSAGISNFLVPFAAGGFIYVASSDFIPELHKHVELRKSFWQLVMFALGISLMLALLFIFK